MKMKLTKLFINLIQSERASGVILLICTIVSLLIVNSSLQTGYLSIWHFKIAGNSFEHWINDGLMAIFFLLIGLELKREIYVGELSNLKNASLPIIAAIGGMLVPAAVFLFFNYGTSTQSGAGIPMATDIAFSLAILSLLGNKIPLSLKIFLTALAVIDDLGAIIVIAIFYTNTVVWLSFGIALSIFAFLLVLNKMKVVNLIPYLLGGVMMWYFMLQSGIHASIAGVLLAFTIPFKSDSTNSPSHVLQHILHKPVAFIVLPLFALANTCLIINAGWQTSFFEVNSIGILTGLIIGKPLGITVFSVLAVMLGFSVLPENVKWKHIIGAGLLGGIGFTMSIFISQLAYPDMDLVNNSKLMILIASAIAAIAGYIWLKVFK
jgi:NhaA family Na+:H+ antiporter